MSALSLRRRRFAWFSAISLGTLFSAATFGLGTGSLDELAISMKLRTVLATEVSWQFTFSDKSISVSRLIAENLPVDGVPYRAVRFIYGSGDPIRKAENGVFKSDIGMSVGNGVIYQGWVDDPQVRAARDIQFCTLVAKYRLGIPVYDYYIGVQQPATVVYPMLPAWETEPEYRLAEKMAREAGWDGTGPITRGVVPTGRAIDSGRTTDWSYCDAMQPGL